MIWLLGAAGAALSKAGLIAQLRVVGLAGLYSYSLVTNILAAKIEKNPVDKRALIFTALVVGIVVFGYLLLYFGPLSLAVWVNIFQWTGWPIALITCRLANRRLRASHHVDVP